MKLLFDFFPIILFFISYYQADFLIENTFIGSLVNPNDPEFITATIVATSIAIIASFIQVGIHWLKKRSVEKMHIFSLVLIVVLGSLTIMLGDPDFVEWKPTVLNWLFAAVFFGSFFIGERTLIQRAMENQLELPEQVWTRLNIAWVTFFLLVVPPTCTWHSTTGSNWTKQPAWTPGSTSNSSASWVSPSYS